MSVLEGEQRSGAVIAALDLLHARERDADHLALQLADEVARLEPAGEVTVGTHAAAVGTLRHVALSIEAVGVDADELHRVLAAHLPADGVAGLLVGTRFDGQPELRDTLTTVVRAHHDRSGGRVVTFAGHRSLVGTVTVGHIRDRTAIDEVQVLAGDRPDDDTAVITRDFVRPRWQGRRLILTTQPARGGTLVPFETPTPTPCCADHA